MQNNILKPTEEIEQKFAVYWEILIRMWRNYRFKWTWRTINDGNENELQRRNFLLITRKIEPRTVNYLNTVDLLVFSFVLSPKNESNICEVRLFSPTIIANTAVDEKERMFNKVNFIEPIQIRLLAKLHVVHTWTEMEVKVSKHTTQLKQVKHV